MNSTDYTLDRIDDGFAVFLQRPDEEEQLLIKQSFVPEAIEVGDIVTITEHNGRYCFEVQQQQTEDAKATVHALMQKLRNKKRK
ncbi:MAG TPA: DUF3006 domain-containing protein [Metalysinibacillus jejuensis]|uniref:DUF3006 domain-containing protein n=1 Tax=Metalysinibacillus jejuensis TaxID=914327 RepID=A0A921NDH0_9BACL|nr:DUF3006 domain-containing protein [Metalysinibacillus jejuensis]